VLSARESDGDLVFVTWVPDEAEPVRLQAQRAWAEIAAVLDASAAIPLQERVFGGLLARPCVLSARRAVAQRRCQELRLLPTFVEAPPLDPTCGDIAGIHVVAARPVEGRADWITAEGRFCGRVVEGRGARFLSFSDPGPLVPGHVPCGTAEDPASAVDRATSALAAAGWSFRDVCRAWIPLADEPASEGAHALSRGAVSERMGRIDGASLAFPATTARGGPRGGGCALDLVAAKPGSRGSFERRRLEGAGGLRLDAGDFRYVFVSATASADALASGGPGDFRSQAFGALESVIALLESEGARLDDIRQSTAFVKRPEDAEDFRCLADACGLWEVPVVAVQSELRREELLFEIDATAALPIPRERSSEDAA
jgi:enamine deaminase RidA (YjgF/YER057c/UK114 family)